MKGVAWKDVTSDNIDVLCNSRRDYIHGLIMTKDWATIRSLVSTDSRYFLKSLHHPHTRKNILVGLKEDEVINLIDLASEDARHQLFQIMLDQVDSNSILSDAALKMFKNPSSHCYVMHHISELVMLFKRDDIKKVLTNPVKSDKKYKMVLHALNGDVDKEGSIVALEMVPRRDICRRVTFFDVLFEVFEDGIKGDPNTPQMRSATELITNFENVWAKVPVLKKRFTDIINNNDLVKMHCDTNYMYLINQSVTSPSYFNFNFIVTHEYIKKENYLSFIIGVLYKDAQQESIRKTNLRRLIKNLYNANPIALAMLSVLRCDAKDGDEKLKKIFERINKEVVGVVAKMITKHHNIQMLRFLVKSLTKPSVPLFDFEGYIATIKSIVETVLSKKEEIVRLSASNYCSLCIEMYNQLAGVPVGRALKDRLLAEHIRHPTRPDVFQDALKSPSYAATLLCKIHDLKLLGQISAMDKQADEFGFVGKTTINFSPLAQSGSKKAVAVEFEHAHGFELFMIRHKLMASNGREHMNFVKRALRAAIKASSVPLLERALEAHYRVVRFNLRDNVGYAAQDVVYADAIQAAATLDKIKGNSDAAERLLGLLRQFPRTQESTAMISGLSKTGLLDADGKALALKMVDEVLPIVLESGAPHCVINVLYPKETTSVNGVPVFNIKIKQYKPMTDAAEAHSIPAKFRAMARKASKKLGEYTFGIDPETVPNYEFVELVNAAVVLKIARAVAAVMGDFKPIVPGTKPAKKFIAANAVGHLMLSLIPRVLLMPTPKYRPAALYDHAQRSNQAYTSAINSVSINFEIRAADASVARSVLRDSWISEFLAEKDSGFLLDTINRFNENYTTKNEQDDKIRNLKPISFSHKVLLKPQTEQGVLYLVRNGQGQAKTETQWLAPYFEEICRRALQCDIDRAMEEIKKDKDGMLAVAELLSFSMPHCKHLESCELLGRMLAFVIEDITTEDPQPTEEDPAPQPSPTYFVQLRRQKNRAPQRRPVRRGRHSRGRGQMKMLSSMCSRDAQPTAINEGTRNPATKSVADPRFSMNLSFIAKIAAMLRLPCVRHSVPLKSFAGSIIKLSKMPQPILDSRLGDRHNNPHKYTVHLCDLVLSKLDFGTEEKAPGWATTMGEEFECLGRLMCLPQFVYPCVNSLLELIRHVPTVAHRRAIITALSSMLVRSTEDESFGLSLVVSIKTVELALDAELIALPLPQSSLSFIEQLCNTQKLHPDVATAIVSGVMNYFKFQDRVTAPPTQFEELFKSLQALFKNRMDLLVPTFCKELDEDEMPHKGEWEPLRERVCQEFVAPALLSKNQKVVTTAMSRLASMAKVPLISKTTAPILAKSLAELGPQDGNTALLEFGISFAASPANAEFAEVSDALAAVFARAREQLDKRATEVAAQVWVQSSQQVRKFDDFNKFYETAASKIDTLVVHEEPKTVDYMRGICTRLKEASRPEVPLASHVSGFNNFINVVSIVEAMDVAGLYGPSMSPSALIKLLEKRSFEFSNTNTTFGSLLQHLHVNKLDLATLKEAAALPAEARSRPSYFLTIAPKELISRKLEDKEDIAPYVSAAAPLTSTPKTREPDVPDFVENQELIGSLARVFQANRRIEYEERARRDAAKGK